MQFIYLVRTREFAKQNQNIYKIGRTEDFLYNRLNGYSKSTEIILALPVNDSIKLETYLKRVFCNLYIRRKDIGDEYFQGDVQLMIRTIVTTLHPNSLYQDFGTDGQQGCLKYFGENIIGCCQFDGHCETCTKHIEKDNTYDFCAFVCSTCKVFRKYKDHETEKELKSYFYEHIIKEPIPETKKNAKVVNINNNLTIHNIINYIQTKDLIFYVTITSNVPDAAERLRYMFTYLMCGNSGKHLFPNEPKYSKAVTFPVTAAKYDIVTNGNICILQGVLRYKHQKNTSMTIKKLENLGDTYYVVKAYCPDICNNNRSHLVKTDIDRFLNPISHSEHGSNIEDFYTPDVN